MDWISISILATILLLIGFFSGIESAFISVSKLTVELRKKQGSYSGRVWSKFMDKSARFIGTSLLLFNLLLILYILTWYSIVGGIFEYWNVTRNEYVEIAVAAVSGTLMLIFVEYIFKSFFRVKSNRVTGSGLFTFIVSAVFSLIGWIAVYFVRASEWIIKYLFNVKIQNKNALFKKDDLGNYIQQLKMTDDEEANELNNEMFEKVLSLSEKRIRECLVPRKEIEAIEAGASIEDLKQLFIKTKLSKLVVYQGNIDTIQGYVHQLDLLKKPQSITDVLLPIPVIPESMKATDLINKFTRERKSIAWVIDEFGGTSGIVTMEDVLEEIFGDIYDEYDIREDLIDKQIASGEYVFSGRLELHYLMDKYQFSFRKSEEADTLSGYIINMHESIPRQRDRIIIDDYQFDILNVSATRIETVKMKILR